MLGFNIEIVVFSLFLVANLAIGLFFSRRVNTLRDYAVGRKDFSTPTLTATIVVSWIGSWCVFEILKNTYKDGLYFIITMSSASICLWLVGVLAVRMREFLKNLSVAEALGDLYGETVRIITAISGVLSVVMLVAIEFKVMSKVISLIFGVESPWIPVIAFAVVVIYSVSGGIRAITFTDLIQFFTFGTFIPILALIIWNQLKDPKVVITLLKTHPNFNWSQVLSWDPKLIKYLIMLLWFMLPAIDPVIFQRVSMARDVEQVKKSFNYASLIALGAYLLLAWVAILLLAHNPNLEPNKLFDYVIINYTSGGLRGLMGIGVLALAMSTADSYLNASAVLLTNDIAKPLGIVFKEKQEVLFARFLCLFSAGCALLVALHFNGFLSLLKFANTLYMPVVSVPLLMAILGFRSTSRAVLIGIGMGLGTMVGWSLIFRGSESIIAGILANLIGLLGSHYILGEPGGWVGIREPQPLLEARAKRHNAWDKLTKGILAFSLRQYLEKALPNPDYLLAVFGVYVIAATYASFYTVSDEIQKQYAGLYHVIEQTALFISTGLLTYPLWPPIFKNKRFITWIWPLSVFYILFCVGTWLVLLSNFHIFQTMIFLLNVVMAFLLFDFSLVFVMLIGGTIGAVYIFKLYAHVPNLSGDFDTLNFKILYGLLLLSSFIALTKYQQDEKQLRSHNAYLHMLQAKHAENLREALQHQERFMYTLSVDCIEGFKWLYERSKMLLKASQQTQTPIQIKEIIEAGIGLLSKQQQAGEYLAEAIYPFKAYLRLDVQSVKVVKLLATLLKSLDKGIIQPNPKIVLEQRIANKEIQCDSAKIQKLILNSLRSIQERNRNNKPITLVVQDAYLIYEINFIPNYFKKLSAIQFILSTIELPLLRETILEEVQVVQLFLPRYIEEGVRTEDEQIVNAHYGSVSCEIKNEEITYIYTIPINLRQIRAEVMDKPQIGLEMGSKNN